MRIYPALKELLSGAIAVTGEQMVICLDIRKESASNEDREAARALIDAMSDLQIAADRALRILRTIEVDRAPSVTMSDMPPILGKAN